MTSATQWSVSTAAGVLLDAETSRADRGPITADWPELDLSTAYDV